MVAKPARHQSIRFSPRLSQEAFFFFFPPLFCPGLSSDPVVILFLKLKKLDYGQICGSEIHRRIPDRTRQERKHIYLYRYIYWYFGAEINKTIVVFQNEPLNSTLALEMRSARQLSLLFRDAWLCEPEIKIQSDIIRQKGILVGYSSCSMSTVFSNYQISILWNTQKEKIGWFWNNSGCISPWMFTLSLYKARFEIIRSRRWALCNTSPPSSPSGVGARSLPAHLHNIL